MKIAAGRLVIAGLALGLAATAPMRAAELLAETVRAYGDYVGAVQRAFEEHSKAGDAFSKIGDMTSIVRDGRAVIEAGSQDGIIDVPGGLIHHWRGVVFIPHVTLREAIAVSQDFSNYKHVYGPILDAGVLERHGDTFHVRIRLQKSAGPVSAVVDVWSVVQYQQRRGDMMYSASDSERISEVRDAGKPDEQHLPPGHGRGYLWRANTFSRMAEENGGVLVELENVGLSRAFPPMLGWIIEPIARRVGKGSVEDSLLEFRRAVLAAHVRSPAASAGAASGRMLAFSMFGLLTPAT